MKFKFKKERGQISRLILVLAIIVLVAVIIVYLVMRMAEKPSAPITEGPTEPVYQPVYEVTLGNIKFVFQSAIDRGNILRASEVTSSQYSSYSEKNLTTKEKYIQVTIGAQNKGTENTDQNAWEIGDIVDSEGRKFVQLEGYTIQPWLPASNYCGVLLKPAFDPAPCTKIYEVSKVSTGLKIQVRTGIGNSASSLSSDKVEEALIDLIVK